MVGKSQAIKGGPRGVGLLPLRKASSVDRVTRWLYYYAMRHVAEQHQTSRAKPLSEPVLLILVSLASKPQHGYALMKDIGDLSQGRVEITTGTLYGALRRLLEDGWIERFDQQDTSREKQAYRLTADGRRSLAMELDRMKQVTKMAAARLRAAEA